MLSELPKACQAVLQADPDPVKIPREALMTGAAVRQVLAKAAAVKAALAKAAATPGAPPAATGATLARRCALICARPSQQRKNNDRQASIVVDEYLDAAARPSGNAGRDGEHQKD